MAAKRSARQLAEVAATIHALYEKSGAATWAEFAQRAGVHPVQLSNWQLGKAEVSGYNLVRLIKAASGVPDQVTEAELLLVELERTRQVLLGAAEHPPTVERQQEILRHLAELGDAVAELAESVSVIQSRLDDGRDGRQRVRGKR